MRRDRVCTNLVPDFACKKRVGFAGSIVGNPFLEFCRSQTDLKVHGDTDALLERMKGFHWMMACGDYLRETGCALRKPGWSCATRARQKSPEDVRAPVLKSPARGVGSAHGCQDIVRRIRRAARRSRRCNAGEIQPGQAGGSSRAQTRRGCGRESAARTRREISRGLPSAAATVGPGGHPRHLLRRLPGATAQAARRLRGPQLLDPPFNRLEPLKAIAGNEY